MNELRWLELRRQFLLLLADIASPCTTPSAVAVARESPLVAVPYSANVASEAAPAAPISLPHVLLLLCWREVVGQLLCTAGITFEHRYFRRTRFANDTANASLRNGVLASVRVMQKWTSSQDLFFPHFSHQCSTCCRHCAQARQIVDCISSGNIC